ncbi:MAG: thiol:disulfide interchange protein DsbA/DsbL [Rhodocyclaceae bacterium]|nr:thiol:disulfide interchange protein DsbA/DsbL [Rhodocyclaceae bacterium]
MKKRSFLNTVAGLAVALVLGAGAAQAQQPTPGRDYAPIVPAQPGDNPGKIEIVEFFSYGCPHCKEFHPLVSKWAAALPADVSFKRVPVSFGRAQWFNLSRLYYAAEAIGELGRLDDAAFVALHEKNVKLYDDATINQFAVQQGVDGRKFADAYNAFGVKSKAQRGDQMAQAYKIQGVPAIAVDGRYLVLNEGLTSYEDLLARTDRLIAKARAERKK